MCTLCSPRSYQAKERVLGSEIGVHVCEWVRHQVHSTVSLHPTWSRHWWEETGVFLEWPEWWAGLCFRGSRLWEFPRPLGWKIIEEWWSASISWCISINRAIAPGPVLLAPCCYIFSWAYVPSCSAAVSAKAIGSWTRILYPAVSSDSAPQQSLDSFCWESEYLEDPSYLRPTASWS
jgi:hypothetical protein